MVLERLSYMGFGLLPPVLRLPDLSSSSHTGYRSTRATKGDQDGGQHRSFACLISLLALGKVHVHIRSMPYFKTLMYYLTIVVILFGMSYIVGVLITLVPSSKVVHQLFMLLQVLRAEKRDARNIYMFSIMGKTLTTKENRCLLRQDGAQSARSVGLVR